MNIITTLGNLTADPVLSSTNGGQQVCKFRIGAQTRRRDENNNYLSVFYNCSVWGKMGETIAKCFHKGDRILVSGDFFARDYRDKNGQDRVSLDIDVRDWDFGGTRPGANQSQQAQAPVQQQRPQAPQVQYGAASPQQFAQPAYAAQPQMPMAPQQPMMQYQPQTYAQQQPPMINPNDPAMQDQIPF